MLRYKPNTAQSLEHKHHKTVFLGHVISELFTAVASASTDFLLPILVTLKTTTSG